MTIHVPCLILNSRMDDLRFYVIFNSILVISGRWEDANNRLFEMDFPFTVEKISPRAGLKLGTARSVDQRLTH